jgi:hypothetical protein
MQKFLIVFIALALAGCANQQTAKPAKTGTTTSNEALFELFGKPRTVDEKVLAKYPLGSNENPIRVSGPAGQRDYLSRLVCSDGSPVASFERHGSMGIGPFGTIVDAYEVICETQQAQSKFTVYLDMYHGEYVETRAAAGFIALKPRRVDQSQ